MSNTFNVQAQGRDFDKSAKMEIKNQSTVLHVTVFLHKTLWYYTYTNYIP